MNTGTTRPRRQRLFQVLVPLLASVLTIVGIELGLTIVHPVPFAIESNMYFEADPFTGFRLKPGGIGHFQMGIPAVANSHGHRDVEVSLKKPPEKFRILVLGDSFTVGSSVRQEEAYPKILEQLLRRRYGTHVEVINAGVGGWDPFQYAQYFEHYGRQFEPDLILIGFFVGNDTFDLATSVDVLSTAILGHRISREAANRPFIRLQVFLYDHSNLARLLFNRGLATSASFTRTRCDEFTEAYLAIQKARLANHLPDTDEQRAKAKNAADQINRIKRLAGNVPVIVALIPDENQINRSLQQRIVAREELSRYDFQMPQSMLVGMFREIGIPTIDLLPRILADHRCLYMNDTHWTPEGHQLAASIIIQELSPFLTQMRIVQ